MRQMNRASERTIDEKTARAVVRRARVMLGAQIVGFVTYVIYTLVA
jgi:hypothetical protein